LWSTSLTCHGALRGDQLCASDSLLDLLSMHLKCEINVALTQVSEWSLRDIAGVSLPPPSVCLGQYPNPTVGTLAQVQDTANFPCGKEDKTLFKTNIIHGVSECNGGMTLTFLCLSYSLPPILPQTDMGRPHHTQTWRIPKMATRKSGFFLVTHLIIKPKPPSGTGTTKVRLGRGFQLQLV
jgi:hypothetical protein